MTKYACAKLRCQHHLSIITYEPIEVCVSICIDSVCACIVLFLFLLLLCCVGDISWCHIALSVATRLHRCVMDV